MEPVVDGRLAMTQIALLRPGDEVELTLLRNGQRLSVGVIVGSRPPRSS